MKCLSNWSKFRCRDQNCCWTSLALPDRASINLSSHRCLAREIGGSHESSLQEHSLQFRGWLFKRNPISRTPLWPPQVYPFSARLGLYYCDTWQHLAASRPRDGIRVVEFMVESPWHQHLQVLSHRLLFRPKLLVRLVCCILRCWPFFVCLCACSRSQMS